MKFSIILFLCIVFELSVSIPFKDQPNRAIKEYAEHKTHLKRSASIRTQSTHVAALGRVADLGDLYDARTDNFLEISLYTTDLAGDAVHTTDNAYSSIDYVRTESLSEKMEKLGVEASLSVSFLSGLVSVSGSGKYLNDDKKSAKSAKTSLIYSLRTVNDDLKIFSKTSRSLMDDFLLTNIDATHVVVGIEWGANVVLSLEETSTDSSNVQQIQGKLEAALDLAVLSVSGSAEVDFGSSDVEKSSTFSLHLNGDIIPNTVPQTINESIAFIRNIPKLIEQENDGKGKIMNYILMPITTVQKVFQGESNNSGVVKEIEQGLIDQFMQIFQEIKDSQLEIDDVYNAIYTWNLMVPESDFSKISVIKEQFDTFANDLKQTFADLVVQFRSGNIDGDKLIELIKSYETSNWTSDHINTLLDAFTQTMHKTELMSLLQSENALFIDRRMDKYKILADNYKNEVRIVSFDLTTEISSSYVSDIIKLLEVESAKGSDVIKYYIEDTAISVPEVNSYLEGKVMHTFPVDKKEYILLTDNSGSVIIIDANSYEQITSYELSSEIGGSAIIVVNSTFYNIQTMKGIIMATDIENIMKSPDSIDWTQVGSFPVSSCGAYGNIALNQSDIYFCTCEGILYSYNMLLKAVTYRGNLHLTTASYSSLIVLDKILYIHKYDRFFSFDGNVIVQITPPDRKVDAGLFPMGNKICRVGGNITEVDRDPVSCYDPSDETWITISYINDFRYYPAVVTTTSGTYILGGQAVGGSSKWRNSVEMFNYQTKIWSYIPTPIINEPQWPQAVRFYF